MTSFQVEEKIMNSRSAVLCFIIFLCFFTGCEREPKLNILLITADTLRSDHLSCYGYERQTSPHIDELASRSVQFMDASTPVNLTNPSHVSIFTAKYPKDHGIYTNWSTLNKEHVTLSEILKKQGYKTAALVSTNHLNADISGLGRGFDFYRNIQKPEAKADETVKDALGWIKRNGKERFFVWIHLFDPHLPYNPPPPYDKIFDPKYDGWGKIFFDVYNQKFSAHEFASNRTLAPFQLETLARAAQGRLLNSDIFSNKIGLTERDVEYARSMYDGEIRFMDEEIGLLFKEMGNLGLSSNTIIIFTADHGESLGEHGIYCDHKGLYEDTIKVPLIIYVPGKAPRKIGSAVSNMDILPTLLDMLHISVSSDIKVAFDGKSLFPLMQGETLEIRDKFFLEQKNNLAKSIKSHGYKYIMPIPGNFVHFPNDYIHHEELYNLRSDPGEKINLMTNVNPQDTPYESLKESLKAWAEKSWIVKRDTKALENLNQEQRDRLKALGYIN